MQPVSVLSLRAIVCSFLLVVATVVASPLRGEDRPFIRVGLYSERPPLSVVDQNGAWVSADVGLLRMVAERGVTGPVGHVMGEFLIWERVRPYIISALGFLIGAMIVLFIWNRRLAAEIQRRRVVEKDLQAIRDNLRSLNEEKSQILAMAAHDLRTPLTNILFQMDVLRMRPQVEKADLDAANERIVEQAKRIHHMVNQLLTADALETGAHHFNLVECDLREPVARAILDHATSALKKDLRLEFFPPDEPVWACVDAYAFAQVLDNLLSNGLKFTPKGGWVRVDLNHSREWAEVQVRDSGPGFSSEDRAQLFKKFRKLSARPTAGEASTGLGLAITHSLVEAMDGQILMERPAESGALMRVRFPAAGVKSSRTDDREKMKGA